MLPAINRRSIIKISLSGSPLIKGLIIIITTLIIKSLLTSLCPPGQRPLWVGDQREAPPSRAALLTSSRALGLWHRTELPLFGKWFDETHHPELVEGEGLAPWSGETYSTGRGEIL